MQAKVKMIKTHRERVSRNFAPHHTMHNSQSIKHRMMKSAEPTKWTGKSTDENLSTVPNHKQSVFSKQVLRYAVHTEDEVK